MVKGDLGDRMKSYEAATRYKLTPRTYTVIRVDGKNFHAFTRGMVEPFDFIFIRAMQDVAEVLMKSISGSLIAYTQSDEISIVLQDFAKHSTQPWMGGVVQKQASISAAMATAAFASWVEEFDADSEFPLFDARTFTIPSIGEVMNYLIWRQQDATRNSISMAAQAEFSHKQLHRASSRQMQEMLWNERGINWNDYPTVIKRGTVVRRESFVGPVQYIDKRTDERVLLPDKQQKRIVVDTECPVFTSEEGREYLEEALKVG